ncbi:MAG: hypothetical protein AB1668_07060 [Nanoarchaeota archaeon]
MWGKLYRKVFVITMLSLLCFLTEKISFAEERKLITSWKDITIGKTTEEEIISSNSEGMVYLSAEKLLALCKNKATLRTITYGSERSHAEAMREYNEFQAWKNQIAKDNKPLSDALSYLEPETGAYSYPKLEEYLKPVLLYNGPIDLGWKKLGRAKLEITSNGTVLGWSMKYWFYDSYNPESFPKNFKETPYPNRKEILGIFEAGLGKPHKILKSESLTDLYIFSFDKRELELKIDYRAENKVIYAEFKEGKSEQELSLREIIELITTSMAKDSEADKETKKKEIAVFANKHKDFEQVRPIMYELSLDPKNASLSLQELYDLAKKRTKNK